jgi:hypothetical protein
MSTAPGARRSRRFAVRTDESVGIVRTRPAWRALKRAEARAPIPTVLRPKAQGCRVREATLGNVIHYFSQPQRGASTVCVPMASTPSGLLNFRNGFPG